MIKHWIGVHIWYFYINNFIILTALKPHRWCLGNYPNIICINCIFHNKVPFVVGFHFLYNRNSLMKKVKCIFLSTLSRMKDFFKRLLTQVTPYSGSSSVLRLHTFPLLSPLEARALTCMWELSIRSVVGGTLPGDALSLVCRLWASALVIRSVNTK